MAKKFLYAALAGVSLLFAGCNEDLVGDYVQPTEKHFGEEIMFGGSASYDVNGNGGTRTIYGGYENITDGAEPVYWVSTDEVRLYCPEAAVKTADYKVSGIDDTKTQTGLSKIGDAGLQWGVPTASHTFYGVYPIPADNSLKEGTTLTGTIPDVQEYKDYTTTDGNVVYNPDMQYAYMVAKTVVPNPNNIGENVYLKFMPIATAVEIELTNNAPTNDANEVVYNFREVHLSSSNHYLSGSFTANLDNMTMPTGSGVQYATASPTGITYVAADQSKQVAVKLYKTDGTAMPLGEGKTLKFTVFMLPSSSADASVDDAIDDLTITVVTSEGNKTGTLSGISVKKSKKTYMHAIPLGYEMTYNQSEWLKFVEDEKALNELSIPGAGGAASGNVFEANPTLQDYYEQSLSIEDLWNVGIRCFEFTVDKHSSDNTKLGEVEVYCNAQETNLTLNDCVSEVKRLLGEHPSEFAMVIITYQQQSGWNVRQADGTVAQTREPATFMTQLNNYWTNLQMPDGTKKALYASGMDVKTARGSLFCIARPTSQGEDNFAVVNTTGSNYELNSTTYSALTTVPTVTDPHILVIHGWGALKDKWYVRGYTDCIYFRGGGNTHFDVLLYGKDNVIGDVDPKTPDELVTMLGYRSDRDIKPGRPFDVSSGSATMSTLSSKEYEGVTSTSQLSTLTPNFFYSTTTQANNTLQANKAWVQEWARVSKDNTVHASQEGFAQWVESYEEKKNHVSSCLDFALNKKITVGSTEYDADGVIFINSLCGYYIEDGLSASANSLTECNVANSLENTFWGDWKFNPLTSASNVAGMSGNIGDFANDINTYFKGLLDTKLQDGRLGGSTGIVLMDRVSNEGDGAAIPSIIIANNFSSDYEATDPTAPTSVVADGDTPLSREGVNVVWGEWE